MTSQKELLEVKNLYKSYGSIKAVRGLSFTVGYGECFGLLGPNGAGKSTTIELIEQILKPDSGGIYYKGKLVGQSFLEEFGAQFQTTALFPYLSVRETLETYSRLYKKRVSVDHLLKLCQLESFAHQKHEKISGGQRQRLAIARALARKPEILILDEATSSLDSESERLIQKSIDSLSGEISIIIIIAHRLSTVVNADKIIVLENGSILESGNFEELMKINGSFKSIYNMQTKGG